MFILTDGKNYVMENPMRQGTYISTTSPIQAKEFTWKQARTLLQNRKKSLSWIRSYNAVNQDTKAIDKDIKYYKGNEGMYLDENAIEFDESIIENIYAETKSIIGLVGWSMTQLKTYEEELLNGLSKYDSAESDIAHALQKYKENNSGKKAQAHKWQKLDIFLMR